MAPAMSLEDLIRRGDFETVARSYRERFGEDLPTEIMECIHRIITDPRAKRLGGTADSPWSDATWLMWFRNRADDLATKSCEQVLSDFLERDVVLPTDVPSWTELLRMYSAEILATDDIGLWSPIAEEARQSGWLGFPPADERTIQYHEERLEVAFPPSLRSFYAATNGWRTTGYSIYNVLPVEQVGWVRDREPDLYSLGEMAETEDRDWPKDPDGSRRGAYRFEQGTRVKRAIALSSEGDSATWLADPFAPDSDGEWPCGTWASWNPGMDWTAGSFAELMRDELKTFLDLRRNR
jgi:hypothetical protein